MKKSLLTAVFALASLGGVAYAQSNDNISVNTDKYIVETNRFWNNWFIDANGGVQVYFGDADSKQSFGKRLAPAMDISLGKWFTPGIGLRVGYMGLQAKGASTSPYAPYASCNSFTKDGETYYKQKWNMMNLHGEVMFNLSNMFAGYNPNRVYSFIPYAGIAWLHAWDTPKTDEMGLTVGLINKFRLSPALDLNIEARGTLVKDGFDGEKGGNSKEGLGALTVGLTYKFKQRDFNRGTVISTGISESEMRRLQNQLRDAQAYNNQLKDEIEALRNRKPEVVYKETSANDSRVVFFQIGKSNLTSRDLVTVQMMAESIKATDKTYKVVGYADSATGSKALNQRLSEARANAVKDALIKEGVKESQLEVVGMGGVDSVFGKDNQLSRVVIVK